MSYFSYFPRIYYNFNVGGKESLITVKDIALNVRVRKEVLENITLYDEYDIEDGETPDIISERLYGKPYYHWTILLVNQRYDHLRDFPMKQVDLERHVTEKYGEGHEYDQHVLNGVLHFEDELGIIRTKLDPIDFAVLFPGKDYDQHYLNLETISNYEHESRLNESKRRIKVLNPQIIDKTVNDIQTLLKE